MRLALTDPLTGPRQPPPLPRAAAARAGRRGARAAGSLSLCLVDIDDFKRINDRFGHPVGDRVLGQVAARLRQGGESFRLGGDEFAVLLPGSTSRPRVAVARSIVERVGALELEQVGAVTVSAGVATYPTQGVGRDELIRLADSALYWAKEDGKNRARTYAARARSSSPSCSSSPTGPTARRATARPRASPRPSTRATPTPAATPSGSASSPPRIARRLGLDEARSS